MEVSLRKLKPGDSAVVVKITGEGVLRRRLFDMGLTPGAHLTVRKVAPLGDPVELSIRGYELSIRKAEAEAVLVEKE
jgi:ferrous iron transport protein A